MLRHGMDFTMQPDVIDDREMMKVSGKDNTADRRATYLLGLDHLLQRILKLEVFTGCDLYCAREGNLRKVNTNIE